MKGIGPALRDGRRAVRLRQYLRNRLITAKRAGLRRAWKAVRRHPIARDDSGVMIASRCWVRCPAARSGRSEETAVVWWRPRGVRDGTRHGLKKIARGTSYGSRRTDGCCSDVDPRDDRIARRMIADNPDDWEAHGWLAFAEQMGVWATSMWTPCRRSGASGTRYGRKPGASGTRRSLRRREDRALRVLGSTRTCLGTGIRSGQDEPTTQQTQSYCQATDYRSTTFDRSRRFSFFGVPPGN
jgi:hypothetical protein